MSRAVNDKNDSDNRFLYLRVKNGLLKEISQGDYLSNQLIPSEKQLCDQYSVSLITVRRALDELAKEGVIEKQQGKGSVVVNNSGETQTTILQQEGNIFNIGILLIGLNQGVYPTKFEYTNNWSSKIIYGMKRILGEQELFMAGLASADQIVEKLPFLPIHKADRVLLLGGWNGSLIQYLKEQGKQVYLYNNFEDNVVVPSVNNDDRESCYQAVQHFINQGHRKIAVINGFYDFSESRERYLGFQGALYQNGMDILPYYVKWGDYTPESGYYLMQELLSSGHSRPTAVFCANDTVAAGAFHAISEAGLKCPEDVSLIGHDNLDLSEHIGPGLSSIDPNFNEVGYLLGKLMMDKQVKNEVYLVKNKFIQRSSTANPLVIKEEIILKI